MKCLYHLPALQKHERHLKSTEIGGGVPLLCVLCVKGLKNNRGEIFRNCRMRTYSNKYASVI